MRVKITKTDHQYFWAATATVLLFGIFIGLFVALGSPGSDEPFSWMRFWLTPAISIGLLWIGFLGYVLTRPEDS